MFYAPLHTGQPYKEENPALCRNLTRPDMPYFIAADLLGERLENEGEGRYRDNANLCYICSGSVDKFVECW